MSRILTATLMLIMNENEFQWAQQIKTAQNPSEFSNSQVLEMRVVEKKTCLAANEWTGNMTFLSNVHKIID